MENLKKLFSKVLAKKKLASLGKGAFINSIVKKFIKEDLRIDLELDGYLDKDVYIIKTNNSLIGNYIFLQKKKLLEHINGKLQELNFETIKDIKVK